MAFTLDPDLTLEQLRTVRRAYIDSSSIIYSIKSGILETLARSLELRTVSGVAGEVGLPLPDIKVDPESTSELPVDDQLIVAAQSARQPVISEDRKLLVKADERGIDSYNMLVMLELLLLRGELPLAGWEDARRRLLAAAHYSPWVVHAGQELHWAVRKEIG